VAKKKTNTALGTYSKILNTPQALAFMQKADPQWLASEAQTQEATKAEEAARKTAKANGQTPTKAVAAAGKKYQTTAGGTYPVKGTLLGGGPGLSDFTGTQAVSPTAGKKAKTTKVTAKSTTPATADALEREIATGPYSKILGAVTQEFQPAEQAATAYASGNLTSAATQGAWAEALTALSGTPSTLGETASAWLGQNLATEQKTTAPLTQAMAAQGAQLQAEQGPILQSLTNLGQGLTLEQATAPESAWLSALGSHITSNLSYYGTIPTAAVTSLPSGVAKALQESGGYGGGSSGVIPVSSLTTKGSTAKATGTTGLGGTALTGEGSVPGVGIAPGQ
jgi:hypothetical protein